MPERTGGGGELIDDEVLVLHIEPAGLTLHQLTYLLVELEYLLYIFGRRSLLGEKVTPDPHAIFALTRHKAARVGGQLRILSIQAGSIDLQLGGLVAVAKVAREVVSLLASVFKWMLQKPVRIQARPERAQKDVVDRSGRIDAIVQVEATSGGSEGDVLRRALRRLHAEGLILTDSERDWAVIRIQRLLELLRR